MCYLTLNSSCCFSPRYASITKTTNPAVVILSNYSPERVYNKALMKDPTALDSLLARLTVVEIPEGEVLDIDGFREAIARASLATTATPTTSEVAEGLNVTTSSSPRELAVDNSTTEIVDLTTESQICTPPTSPRSQTSSTQSPTPPVDQLLPVLGTPPPSPVVNNYQIIEDELIDAPISIADGKRPETNYERFQRERREKIRKQHTERESAIDRIARKGNNILFTGYN